MSQTLHVISYMGVLVTRTTATVGIHMAFTLYSVGNQRANLSPERILCVKNNIIM